MHYFAQGYILAPFTIYEGVNKLEPASYLRWRKGRKPIIERYWDYADCFRHETTITDDRELLEELTGWFSKRSPGGWSATCRSALSSGGLDLLSVRDGGWAACLPASDLLRRSVKPATMRAAMPRSARHLGTQHFNEIDRATIPTLLRAIGAYDEPFSDTSLIPMAAVARRAAQM